MPKRNPATGPAEKPWPVIPPEQNPDAIPAAPLTPAEDPDIIPEETPFELPPNELPSPGDHT